jgi:PhnB protein
MAQISSYLTFNGNCRAAMMFYKECLGGELFFQTIGESPLSEKMPQQMKDCILHSTLTKEGLLLMGSDIVPDSGLAGGNTVSLFLNCSSEEEIQTCYKNLSVEARAKFPLQHTFWGALFGGLTDKFGFHWMLSFDQTQHKFQTIKYK